MLQLVCDILACYFLAFWYNRSLQCQSELLNWHWQFDTSYCAHYNLVDLELNSVWGKLQHYPLWHKKLFPVCSCLCIYESRGICVHLCECRATNLLNFMLADHFHLWRWLFDVRRANVSISSHDYYCYQTSY